MWYGKGATMDSTCSTDRITLALNTLKSDLVSEYMCVHVLIER